MVPERIYLDGGEAVGFPEAVGLVLAAVLGSVVERHPLGLAVGKVIAGLLLLLAVAHHTRVLLLLLLLLLVVREQRWRRWWWWGVAAGIV